ncbi:hypothetical protein V8E36_006097 [Tilletia maclaganii]
MVFIGRRRGRRWLFFSLFSVAHSAALHPDPRQDPSTYGSTPTPQLARWGAASTQLDGLLILHGGKATANAGYTYTSAPDSSDLLLLNLTQPFSLADPPWQNFSTPATASFHTLAPHSASAGDYLLFGGQDSTTPTPSGNDSLWLLNLANPAAPGWTEGGTAWNQPIRRMLHTSPSDPVSQAYYLLGGVRADGSNMPTQELWHLLNGQNTFELLPTPPTNIVDGAAPLLADGSIVLVGGVNESATNTLAQMDILTSYNPLSQAWTRTTTSSAAADSSFPSPRRAHIAIPLPENRIFLHGGASADLSQAYSDAWILDWAQSPPLWSPVLSSSSASDSPPPARFAHSAVSYGQNVILAFGWGGNNAVDTALWVWDGTRATTSGSGGITGGRWISASSSYSGGGGGGVSSGGGSQASVGMYTPDPNAQAQSNGLNLNTAAGSSNSGKGGHSGSHNGGSSTTSGNKGPSKSSPPSGTTKPDDPDGPGDDTPAGAKAGIILGALMGLGLAAGAGYYAYRAYQNYNHPYGGGRGRHGGGGPGYGKAALLGQGSGYEDDEAHYSNLADSRNGGGGALWTAGGAAAAAAAAAGFLSDSLGGNGRKRRRELEGIDVGGGGAGAGGEQLMLEKGHYARLQNHDFSHVGTASPTGAVVGTPTPALAGDRRLLPPIGPRGPKALSRNEYYNAALEAGERLRQQDLLATSSSSRTYQNVKSGGGKGRGRDESDGSLGGKAGEIPMAGGAVALAAAQAGMRAGVRGKIARLVGHNRDSHADALGTAAGMGSSGALIGASGSGGGGGALGPRRLDILADEDADEDALRRKYPRQYGAARRMVDPFADPLGVDGDHDHGHTDEDDHDDDDAVTAGRQQRTGYGALRMTEEDDDDDILEYADRAAPGRTRFVEPDYREEQGGDEDGYIVSPFEDSHAVGEAALQQQRQAKGKVVGIKPVLNYRSTSLAHERGAGSSRHPHQQASLFSNMLSTSASGGGGGAGRAWADADSAQNHGALEGLDDDQGAGGGGLAGAQSPLMRRSGTWWDRFMATSFLDRSSSGAIARQQQHLQQQQGGGPQRRTVDPLRDPRKLNESMTSLDTVAESEAAGGPTGAGARAGPSSAVGSDVILQPHGGKHTRSLSSLQSARTATSSVLEARLAGMDVVQRSHTLTSSRGASSSMGAASEDGNSSIVSTPISRGPSLREQSRDGRYRAAGGYDLASVAEDPDHSSSHHWDANPWSGGRNDAAGRFDDADDPESSSNADRSADIVDQQPRQPPSPLNFGVELRKSPQKTEKLLVRSPSEAPSITPSITKRSRQNSKLTTPVSPLLTHVPPAPLKGSVRDRVEALERKYSADEVSLASGSGSGAGSTRSGVQPGSDPVANTWLGQMAFHTAAAEAAGNKRGDGATTPTTTTTTTSVGHSLFAVADPLGLAGDSLYAPTVATSGPPSTSAGSYQDHTAVFMAKTTSSGAGSGSTRPRTRSNSPSRTAQASTSAAAATGVKLGSSSTRPLSVTSSGAASGSHASGATGTGRTRTTIGLVPKAQLFVANPDRRGMS